MKTITAIKARAGFAKFLGIVAKRDNPIRIAGRNNNAILVSAEYWDGLRETLYLLSRPKMRKTVIRGLKTPITRCAKKVKW